MNKYFAAIATHIIHFVNFILIELRMFHHLKEAKNKSPAYEFGIVSTVIGGFLQMFSWFCTIKLKTDVRKWLPNLFFVLSTMVQYGITLHYSHLLVNKQNNPTTNSTESTADALSECVTLELLGEKTTFYILLLTLPSLIITNMLYYQTGDDKNGRAALYNAYAALDIIDMAELIFADVGCYINDDKFGTGWLAVFYICCFVSAILTCFTAYGLEQPKSKDDGDNVNVTKRDSIATLFSAIFNDAMFLILRIVTMAKTGHAYFGLIFAIKEFLSLCFRIKMLFW